MHLYSLVLKAWKIHGKNHGKFMRKNPWIPLKTMEYGVGAKFHGFHGDIFMLSMLAWDRKIVRIFPMKAWEAWDKNHGKHGNLQK